jgi:NodT family efflux transporter outer membrane factor (OMF) lipoprotein
LKYAKQFAVSILLGMACAGCQLDQWVKNGFKVGPNYSTPPAPVATEWIDYRTPSTQPAMQPATQPASSAQYDEWWRVFNDPVLNSLVSDAYKQNIDLRTAGERILEARAARDIAIGNLFPQTQNLAGSQTVNKISNRTSPPFGSTPGTLLSPNQYFQNVNVGLNVGWEIDFWGRFRRAVEGADASLEASMYDYDNVVVLLLSDVANTYVNYRTFQMRLMYARKNADIQRQAYELAQNNFKAGATTERDMQQAKTIYEQTLSLVPDFELGVRQNNNALCVLLGIPVQDLSSRLGETGTIPTAPLQVAVGIPADLLRRRPDVRQAERFAASQSAKIGVAISDLYPHFSINGSIGLNAEYIGGLWHTPGSMAGSFGPSFQWDILNYGRIENAIKGQEARFREFMLQYQQIVLAADQDAENAITSLEKSNEKAVILLESVTAARRTVQITYDQYRGGVVDFTPVFLFEQNLTQQEDDLAVAQGNIALSVVGIYRALGGGWEAPPQPVAVPPAPATQPMTSNDLFRPTPPPATTRPAGTR